MKLNIGSRLRAWARGLVRDEEAAAPVVRFQPPDMLPGVVPKDEMIAMDSELSNVYNYLNSSAHCFESFPGYPLLAQLTQQAEYRMLSEKTAMAMVRKWIKLRSKGDEDKAERIAVIEAEMERLRVRELFGDAAKTDGFFGRAQIFVDLGEQQGAGLANPLFIDKAVLKGKLQRLTLVEPMWTYPNVYSASNPLARDYYQPSTWFVMGQKVHSSRLLTFIGRPVPDILKPAYNFGGLSMTQLSRPYVENWIRTRDSVNRLISNFSTSGIKTNLGDVLAGGDGDDVMQRAEMYTTMRDNQGLMVLDHETEEFFQFNAPLSTLDKLQAQAQEHMASVSSMPLSVLLGITPTGLNASTDGEIRIFYDHVGDMQNALFRDNLATVLRIVQLSMDGEVDEDIVFDFVSLWQQDDTELAANHKSDAEAAAILVEIGAITPEEVREKLGRDEHSGYNGLDLGIKIEADDETARTDE